MSARDWAHDLSSGVAAALDLFDPPDQIDEALLARVLRQIADEGDSLGHSLFLRSVADALDHPNADRRLRLGKAKRGRPADRSAALDRAMLIGPIVARRVARGWKKEAAVQEVMSGLHLSRSAVLRSCAEYDRLRPIFNEVHAVCDFQGAVRSAKSRNS